MSALTFIKLAKVVAKAIRKDRDHLARLNEDYFVGRFKDRVFGHEIPDFACKDFRIVNRELYALRTPDGQPPNADGATICPDKVLKFDLAPAWIPHDGGYPWIDTMAADPSWQAAGWTKAEIRAMWDGVLGDIALYQANKLPWYHRVYAKPVSRGMYGGTRLFGGIAHWVYRRSDRVHGLILAASVLASALVSGCVSIFDPPNIFEPSGVAPNYTIEKREGGESCVAGQVFDALDRVEDNVKGK